MVELDLASTCLALVLFGEAGDNFNNQMAVYNVVMNRAKTISKVCDVVYEPKQFEYISLIQQGKAKEPTQVQLLTYKLQAVKFLTKAKDIHIILWGILNSSTTQESTPVKMFSKSL